MIVETIAGCVVVADPVDWSQAVRLARAYPVETTAALLAGEDRVLLDPAARRRQDHLVLASTAWQSAGLAHRLHEAKRLGNALVPMWGMPAQIVGRPRPMRLTVAGPTCPFTEGQKIIMVQPPSKFGAGVIRRITIDCGTADGGDFDDESDYLVQGNGTETTTDYVWINALDPVLPMPVYQTMRKQTSATQPGSELIYEFGGLDPDVPVLLRLGWADFTAKTGPDLLPALKEMVLTIVGKTTTTAPTWAGYSHAYVINPEVEAGGFKKQFHERYEAMPAADGSLQVRLAANCAYWENDAWVWEAWLNCLTLWQCSWDLNMVGAVVANGTDWDLILDHEPMGAWSEAVQVWPVLSGRVTVQSDQAITGRVLRASLVVQEPAGAGEVPAYERGYEACVSGAPPIDPNAEDRPAPPTDNPGLTDIGDAPGVPEIVQPQKFDGRFYYSTGESYTYGGKTGPIWFSGSGDESFNGYEALYQKVKDWMLAEFWSWAATQPIVVVGQPTFEFEAAPGAERQTIVNYWNGSWSWMGDQMFPPTDTQYYDESGNNGFWCKPVVLYTYSPKSS